MDEAAIRKAVSDELDARAIQEKEIDVEASQQVAIALIGGFCIGLAALGLVEIISLMTGWALLDNNLVMSVCTMPSVAWVTWCSHRDVFN